VVEFREVAALARHPLLAGLTREQARAVTHGAGPLLLLAGPAPARPAR
jgi:hypothetical protein